MSDKRARAYLEVVLQRTLDELRAGDNGRNNALNRAAFKLGQWIGAGLDADTAERELVAVAESLGMGTKEAEYHVRRALKQGRAEPRELPTELGDVQPTTPSRPVLPKPKPPPKRPPLDELHALLSACVPVTDDGEVATWLRDKRAISPDLVAERGLACALPKGTSVPIWADYWPRGGYRLLVPTWNAAGELASVRARSIGTGTVKKGKSRAPTGYDAGGLVAADDLAREVLQTGGLPSWWPAERRLELVFTEGEPDYLTWAARIDHADTCSPAVLGVGGGAWSDELAARIPDGALVVIRTHHDDTGNRYASKIHRSLAARCDVRRSTK